MATIIEEKEMEGEKDAFIFVCLFVWTDTHCDRGGNLHAFSFYYWPRLGERKIHSHEKNTNSSFFSKERDTKTEGQRGTRSTKNMATQNQAGKGHV